MTATATATAAHPAAAAASAAVAVADEPWAATAPHGARVRVSPRLPRRTVWPYAGAVSGLAAAGAAMFLAQGPDTFDKDFDATTASVWDAMNSPQLQMLGAGLAFLSVAASVPFLVGLLRHVDIRAPHRAGLRSALRLIAAAFIGSTSIGVVMHYIAAGGADGGIDQHMYTREASTTLAVLADQLNTGTYLPGLGILAIVGFLAVRDRILPRAVGVASLVLVAVSTAMTLGLGLPYSSGLVTPLFMLIVAAAGIFTRKPA